MLNLTQEEKQELIDEMKAMTETNKELIKDNMELCRKMDILIERFDNICNGAK